MFVQCLLVQTLLLSARGQMVNRFGQTDTTNVADLPPTQQRIFRQSPTNRVVYPEYSIRQPSLFQRQEASQAQIAPRNVRLTQDQQLNNGPITRQLNSQNRQLINERSSTGQRSLSTLQLGRIDPSGRIVPLTPTEREEFIRKGGKLVGQLNNRQVQTNDRWPQQQRPDTQAKPQTARNTRYTNSNSFLGFNRPSNVLSDNFAPQPSDQRRVPIQNQFPRDGGRFIQDGGRLNQDGGRFSQDGGRFNQDGGRFSQDSGRFVQDNGRLNQDSGRFGQDGGRFSQDGGRFTQDGGRTFQDGRLPPARDAGSSLLRRDEEMWWRQQEDLRARQRLMQKKEEELQKARNLQRETELSNSLSDKTQVGIPEIPQPKTVAELPLPEPTTVVYTTTTSTTTTTTPTPTTTTTTTTTPIPETSTPIPEQKTTPANTPPPPAAVSETTTSRPIPVEQVNAAPSPVIVEHTTEKPATTTEITSAPNIVRTGTLSKVNVTFFLGMSHSKATTTQSPTTQAPIQIVTSDIVKITINTALQSDPAGTSSKVESQANSVNHPAVGLGQESKVPLTLDPAAPASSGYDAKVNDLIRQMAIDMLLSRIKQSQVQPSPAGFDSQIAAELIRLLGGNSTVLAQAATTQAPPHVPTEAPPHVPTQEPPHVPIAVETTTTSSVKPAETTGSSLASVPETPAPSSKSVNSSPASKAPLQDLVTIATPVSRPAINNFSLQLASLAQNVIEALLQQSYSGVQSYDGPLARAANVLLGEIRSLTGSHNVSTLNSTSLLAGGLSALTGQAAAVAPPAAETPSSSSAVHPTSSAPHYAEALPGNASDTTTLTPVEGLNVTFDPLATSEALNATLVALNVTEGTTTPPPTEPTEYVPTEPTNIPPLFVASPGMGNDLTMQLPKSEINQILSASGQQSADSTKTALVLLLAKYYGISVAAAQAITNMMAVVKDSSAAPQTETADLMSLGGNAEQPVAGANDAKEISEGSLITSPEPTRASSSSAQVNASKGDASVVAESSTAVSLQGSPTDVEPTTLTISATETDAAEPPTTAPLNENESTTPAAVVRSLTLSTSLNETVDEASGTALTSTEAATTLNVSTSPLNTNSSLALLSGSEMSTTSPSYNHPAESATSPSLSSSQPESSTALLRTEPHVSSTASLATTSILSTSTARIASTLSGEEAQTSTSVPQQETPTTLSATSPAQPTETVASSTQSVESKLSFLVNSLSKLASDLAAKKLALESSTPLAPDADLSTTPSNVTTTIV